MNQITISANILKENDYKSFKSPSDEAHIVNRWQKCITDEKGKKYFININQTYGWNVGIRGSDIPEDKHNFWPSIQFETPKGSVEIQLVQWFNESGQYSGNTIQDMEEYFEKIWLLHDSPYYELY